MMEKDDRYVQFLKWFTQNGGLHCHIDLPVRFPPTQYVGVAANQHVPAKKVILAVPKKIIISQETVRKSQIGFLINKYVILCDEEDDDTQFNILALFLIYEKMKGNKSFYQPYFRCVEKAETIINWSNEQINQLGDPFINISYVEQIRSQFQPIWKTFETIVSTHQNLFNYQLNRQLFFQCYGMVMTRCFGWGLPYTMMVPFADFLNHSSCGVYHYIYNAQLEQEHECSHPDYIIKNRQLDLQIFNIFNKSNLPISYVPDLRQQYIQTHKQLINKQIKQNSYSKMTKNTRDKLMNLIRYKQHKNTFLDNILLLSSDTQDNDTDQENNNLFPEDYVNQNNFIKDINKINIKLEKKFKEPCPLINREFQDDVCFDWWEKFPEVDNYFIVATEREMQNGDQIFNSYGRRSNRFLLQWYGFTISKNKYDSVPFRIWNQQVQLKTGQIILAEYLTDRKCKDLLHIGNMRYLYNSLSDEYRLKEQNLCYELMVYLRAKIINNSSKYDRKSILESYKIVNLCIQLEILQQYKIILLNLQKAYQVNISWNYQHLKGHRLHFAKGLRLSNQYIINMHLENINILIQVVNLLKKGSNIVELYMKVHSKEQQNNEQIRIRNRLMSKDYFKMLNNYLEDVE